VAAVPDVNLDVPPAEGTLQKEKPRPVKTPDVQPAEVPAPTPKKEPMSPRDGRPVGGGKPAGQPASTTPARHPIPQAVDLRAACSEAGYRDSLDLMTIRSFVEYGPRERALPMAKADQVDRPQIRQEMVTHQKEVAGQAFALRGLALRIPDRGDVDARGLAVVVRLGFRLFRDGPADGGVRSPSLGSVHLSRANPMEYWFLAKDKRVIRCQSVAEVREVEKNDGFLYHPESLTTDLGLILTVDREAAKQIGRNPKDYTVDVVIENLQCEAPWEWGFYLRKSLIEEDWDCDTLTVPDTGVKEAPDCFEVDATKEGPCVRATLLAVNLRDANGNSVASYLVDEQYRHLLVSPADKIPERKAGLLRSLQDQLKDKSPAARTEAATSLGKLGAEAAPAAGALAGLLGDPSPNVRAAAAVALAAIGPGAVPALTEALRSENAGTREAAIEAFALAGPKGKGGVPALIAALQDKAGSVRRGAALALGKIGPDAKEAIPALVALATDRDPQTRLMAAAAVQAIQNPRASVGPPGSNR
jgi:hypothetical protein